jgi:hypothetical protein
LEQFGQKDIWQRGRLHYVLYVIKKDQRVTLVIGLGQDYPQKSKEKLKQRESFNTMKGNDKNV